MKIEKILHIDDEPVEVSSIAETFQEAGYRYTVFVWPYDAEAPDEEGDFTRLPSFGEYDLILLDIIMGSGNLGVRQTEGGFLTGLFFYKKYIAPCFPNKPVVFISALTDGTFQERAREFAKQHRIAYISKSGETAAEVLREIERLKTI